VSPVINAGNWVELEKIMSLDLSDTSSYNLKLVFAKGFFEFIDGEDSVVLNERICLKVLAIGCFFAPSASRGRLGCGWVAVRESNEIS
jgi:hypothetical protein